MIGFLAGTALALILTASSSASPRLRIPSEPLAPQPAARSYSTPGSMPKPSSLQPMDNGIRFRGTLPASDAELPRHQTPLTPAAETRSEQPEKFTAPAAVTQPSLAGQSPRP